MHRVSLLSVILAACLATSIALAAGDKVSTDFQSLAASGVTGKADLNPMKAGQTFVHGSLRGLAPGVEYVSLIYQDGSCTAGGPTTEVARYTANNTGTANFNQKVDVDITTIKSISVQRVSDNALQACAPVN